jgi:flagellar basal-body rod modification protein FlgD
VSSSISALSGISSLLDAYGSGTTGTDAVGTTSDTSSSSSSSFAKANFGLSTDEFFSLFLAQLKNQDPTQPVDDKEMVSQLAQFTMIKTLEDVSSSLKGSRLAEAAGLIGKKVTGFDESGASVTGVVDRVDQTADSFWLVVGDSRIAPESVSNVTTAPASATTA